MNKEIGTFCDKQISTMDKEELLKVILYLKGEIGRLKIREITTEEEMSRMGFNKLKKFNFLKELKSDFLSKLFNNKYKTKTD